VETSKPYFELGYTSCKIFAIKHQRDGSEPREVYLQNRFNERYMRAFFRKPDEITMAKYDERRLIAQKELERIAIASLTKSNEEEIQAPAKTKKGDILKQAYQEYTEKFRDTLTLKMYCKHNKLPYQQMCNVAHQGDEE
jgi:hypothetical protein